MTHLASVPYLTPEEEQQLFAGYPVVDGNQQAAFDRIVERLFVEFPAANEELLMQAALREAMESVPTVEEAAKAIAAMRAWPGFCYLAFHGSRGRAQFLKVGISRHPEKRLYGMATNNPLDCLWAFTVKLPSAKRAYAVEQEILRHLASHHRKGEWFEIEADRDDALSLARVLSAVAQGVEPSAADFEMMQGARHGE